MASKEVGGLGVGSLESFNLALLVKWVWRFLSNPDSLWAKIISVIYGPRVLDINFSQRYSVWGDILKTLKGYKEKGLVILDCFRKKVGDGRSTSFWDSSWLLDEPLKDRFPRIYALELDKNASVLDRGSRRDLMAWMEVFRRNPRGGVEETQFTDLLSVMASFQFSPQSDRWVCSISGDGSFSVSSFRIFFNNWALNEDGTPTRWLRLIPKKVNIFLWRLGLNRLPTLDNLARRDVDIPSLLCPCCLDTIEDRDHLFFACSLASDLRRLFSTWWGVVIPPLDGYRAWNDWVASLRLRGGGIEAILASFVIMLWSLWKYRNELLFNSKKPRRAVLFDSVVTQSYLWCNYRSSRKCINWVGWLIDPIRSL